MPRNSLLPVEVVIRQVKEDADLDGLPVVKANLLSRARGLQKLGLSQDEQDIAIGLLFCRRFLLTAIPSGRLGTPEGVNLMVRVLEQLHKGQNSLRRGSRRPTPLSPLRRKMPPIQSNARQGAGTPPAEVDDDAPMGAGGPDVE